MWEVCLGDRQILKAKVILRQGSSLMCRINFEARRSSRGAPHREETQKIMTPNYREKDTYVDDLFCSSYEDDNREREQPERERGRGRDIKGWGDCGGRGKEGRGARTPCVGCHNLKQ